MRRRSVSCSRWARAGLDRREGLNLSHRFSCAVSELWVAGYFGGPGRTVGVFGGIGEERDCSRPMLKRPHHISTSGPVCGDQVTGAADSLRSNVAS
jgi:hypothetical protein